MRCRLLFACACLVLLASEASGGGEPRVVPLAATPPHNRGGFDVSYDPRSFPSLDAALQDCRAGRVSPADCDARPVVSLGGYDFLSLAARWSEDGRPMLAVEVLARDGRSGKTWSLFSVAIKQGFGATGHVEYFTSPAGPLLRVPVQLSGTGAFNAHFHFLWRDGAWEEIDAQGWLKGLKLPPGHGIWKGVAVDPRTFTAHSRVWRDGDPNCCPSGGEVEVRLALKGRRLEIESHSHRPPPTQ
jgi:hypothetical protein